jgi:biotin carboxyl carrier protein
MLMNDAPLPKHAAGGMAHARQAGMQCVLQAAHFAEAVSALASEVASQAACRRVAVGWMQGGDLRVIGLSHGADAVLRGALPDVAEAMFEAAQQRASIALPSDSKGLPLITQGHQLLMRQQGLAGVLTVPLAQHGEVVGALLCERLDEPFTAADVLALEQLAGNVTPLLILKRELERPWHERLLRRAQRLLARWRDPREVALRWGVRLGALALLGLLAVPLPHRVVANARLDGAVQRVMTAPQDGYLRAVHVRPGDVVKTGQVLAELSDDELQHMRRARQAELAQHENAFAEAFARGDRAQAAVEQAKAAESRAQLDLADEQLTRTRLLAPFDGVVIQGDLTQMLGAPVKRADTLLVLAPGLQYRVMLAVAEPDVSGLKVGQSGRLLLSALPNQPLAFKVARITPVTKLTDGALHYEIEAQLVAEPALQQALQQLRPGLQGVGKIDQPAEPLAWRWGRQAWGWLRYAVWAWF